MRLNEGDDLRVSFLMSRSKENHRLMEVELGCEIHQHSGKLLAPFKNKYYIEFHPILKFVSMGACYTVYY